MSLRFSPTWNNRNGEVDGLGFNGWMESLSKFGVNGIAYATEAIKQSGTAYCPNLNQFEGYCRQVGMGSGNREGLSPGSEQFHGGKLKPTPNGVPMSFMTDVEPSVETMLSSPHHEDNAIGATMEENGWTYQQYRQNRCSVLGLDYHQ